MVDKSFCISLREYQTLLSSGSIDPALKGLRQMAEGRRRREERLHRSWKKRHFETYWGEALSETKINAKKGGATSSASKKRKAPSAAQSEDEGKASGGGGGGVEKRKRRTEQQVMDEEEKGRRSSTQLRVGGSRGSRVRSSGAATAADSEVTESDASVDSDEGGDETESDEEPQSPSSPLSPASVDSSEPQPLHRRFRSSHPTIVTVRDEEVESTGSPYSPPLWTPFKVHHLFRRRCCCLSPHLEFLSPFPPPIPSSSASISVPPASVTSNAPSSSSGPPVYPPPPHSP